MNPRVSVVIAAFQEERAIGDVVCAALAAVNDSEVVVVDDGSTDATSEAARSAGAHVHRLSVNQGKGAAVRAGLSLARGEFIVLIDGDGQDDPAEIPLLLAALEHADLAVGSRFLGRFEAGAITTINRAGNRFLTEVVNALFGVQLTDTQAGFKALRRELVQQLDLRAGRYDIEVDVLLGVLARRGRVIEVPVRRSPRPFGHSHLNSVIDGTRILLRIVSKAARARR